MQHEKRSRDNAPGVNSPSANSTDANSPDDWPADPEERAACVDIHRRMLASLVGLPRVCAVKKCRRRNRCFGTGQPCLVHHRGLVAARFEAAWQRTGWGPLPK